MVSSRIDLNNLFIFELANNHQGDISHGREIIQQMGSVCRQHGVLGAIKFQFRDLDSFIHPDHKQNQENKHISRFQKTRLSLDEFKVLKRFIEDEGMLSVCTPFDEISVDHVLELDFDIIKIASCSAQDKPLLEKIRSSSKPIIASTAGLALDEIDTLVAHFSHHTQPFALLHCVALYPTPSDQFRLDRISQLKARYPSLIIGFSSHEEPEDFNTVQLAYAQGARIFEKHVGLPHHTGNLNAYSATPGQIHQWLESWKNAASKCNATSPPTTQELEALRNLKRGVFAKNNIRKGQIINASDIYFAMPLTSSSQLSCDDWQIGTEAQRDYSSNEAIIANEKIPSLLNKIQNSTQTLLQAAGIRIPRSASHHLSHHYGMDHFLQFGAVIFTYFNHSYCKKILTLLPGQTHPNHFHTKKDETFEILFGEIDITIKSVTQTLKVGDVLHLPPGTWHTFSTTHGAVIEEISTPHQEGDTIYEDTKIASLLPQQRKTFLL